MLTSIGDIWHKTYTMCRGAHWIIQRRWKSPWHVGTPEWRNLALPTDMDTSMNVVGGGDLTAEAVLTLWIL